MCRDLCSLAGACLVVLSYPDLAVVYERTRMTKLSLPYIPGFLAFRYVRRFIDAHCYPAATVCVYPQPCSSNGCRFAWAQLPRPPTTLCVLTLCCLPVRSINSECPALLDLLSELRSEPSNPVPQVL